MRCSTCQHAISSDGKAIHACPGDRFGPGDFSAYFDGQYLGSRATSLQCLALLDEYVFDLLRYGLMPSQWELAMEAEELAETFAEAA